MKTLIFYEKPGCITNGKQKKLLRKLGISLDVRNLLTEKWRKEELLEHFAGREWAECINRNAPRVKSGEIVPENVNASIVDDMLADPLLIRRPLLAWDKQKWLGFDPEEILGRLGLNADLLEKLEGNHSVDETCSHSHGSGVAEQRQSEQKT